MFEFDENRPDYFADPEPEAQPAPEAGNTIDFGPDPNASADTPRRRSPWRKVLAWVIILCVIGAAIWVWIRYFNPYAEEARIDAYITNVERRGVIFKTWEADIISEQALTDTARVYSRAASVTIPDEALAARLRQAQGTGRPVTLVTSRYYGMLPWRGGSTTVVTAVE